MSDLITEAEFQAELRVLAEKLPTLKKLISGDHPKLTWEQMPIHLKRDAYKRLGIEPVQMYRRVSAPQSDEEVSK